MSLVKILLAIGAGGLTLFILRVAIAASNGRDLEGSLTRGAVFMASIAIGVLTAIQVGLVGLGDAGMLVGDFVAGHPLAVSQALTGALGALGLAGVIEIGPATFVGVVFLLGAGVLIAGEIR